MFSKYLENTEGQSFLPLPHVESVWNVCLLCFYSDLYSKCFVFYQIFMDVSFGKLYYYDSYKTFQIYRTYN